MGILRYKTKPKYQVKDEDVNLLVEHLARIGGKTSVAHIKDALKALAWNPCDFSAPQNIDWGEVVNVAAKKGVIKLGTIKYGYQSREMIWLPHINPKPQIMTRKVLSSLLACIFSTVVFANPVVTDITAKQRFPWNGLVDITLTLSGTEEECKAATWEFCATNKTTNAELLIASVSEVGTVTGEGSQWTRRFVWNAVEDIGKAQFGEVVLSVSVWKPTAVQLWENGPYWATSNVGATRPEQCGYYFWWGDTVGYKRNANNNGWISVKDGSSFSFDSGNCPTSIKNNSQLQSAGYIDSTCSLVAKYDAATAHWGVGWRMPTDAEFSELIDKCTTTWTTRNGVSGRLVTGKDAYVSKSIFLPAAGGGIDSNIYALGTWGYYWSSTSNNSSDTYTLLLGFYSGNFYRDDEARLRGMPIRPVRGFAK